MKALGVFTDLYGAGAEMTVPRALLISLVGFLLVFVILGVLALFVKGQGLIFDLIGKKTKKQTLVPAAPAAPVAPELPKTESQGEIKLIGVTEEEAAILMAIVARDSGIDLNHLKFESIRALEEDK